jgi:hypothetical protein
MIREFDQLSKEIQIAIAEMNADINTTVHFNSPQMLRLALLPNFRPDIIRGEVEVVRPRFVFFKLLKQHGNLGRYVFDRIE